MHSQHDSNSMILYSSHPLRQD